MYRARQPAVDADWWNRRSTDSWQQESDLGQPVAGVRHDGSIVALEARGKALDAQRRYLVASVRDATDRLRHEADLGAATSSHSEIQHLIAELAERFVTDESDAVDATVLEGLHRIAEALGLDQAVLWRKSANDTDAMASHVWIKPGQSAPANLVRLASVRLVAAKLHSGEAMWFTHIEDVPDPADREALRQHSIRSAIVVPVVLNGGASESGIALAFCSTTTDHGWAPAVIEQLRLVSGVFALALARVASLRALQRALDELSGLKERVAEQTGPGPSVVKPFPGPRSIVSEAPAVREALWQVEQVAPTPATVLLLGETGVGKEVFARAIHELSPRRCRPMIRVSCAAIPSSLIESELFGRERGAYTGALSRQIGRFEAANQSTLFLDEIGELSAEVQIKLLRVLQERVIERLGSTQPVKVDVRIIAATNCNLEKAVEENRFREDLFYRLNVFPIVIPPLRERVEEIPTLAWTFVNEFSRTLGKRIESISKESLRQLQQYSWPGNVRELRNVIERAVIIASGPQLTVSIPAPVGTRPPRASSTLRDLEMEQILATLRITNWRIRGVGGAAARLGLKPTTLETRMAKLGVIRPQRT
jgi:transcriptional regulator with GAF, ATPase, and Fis domain